MNIIRVSNSLDPDQDQHSVGPDLGSNCLSSYPQTTNCVPSMERANTRMRGDMLVLINFIGVEWVHKLVSSIERLIFTLIPVSFVKKYAKQNLNIESKSYTRVLQDGLRLKIIIPPVRSI